MKQYTIMASEAMFGRNPELRTTMTIGGQFVDLGASMIANSSISCPGRIKHQSSARSRISRAAFATDLKLVNRSGRFTVCSDGENLLTKTDGKTVWTNADPSKENDLYQTVISTLVHYFAGKNELVRNYIANVNNGTAEKNDAFKASDEFYYSYLVENRINEISVSTGCPDSEFEEDTSAEISSKCNPFPWYSEEFGHIPNDFSVESAKKGKYRLNWNSGAVSLSSGKSYDFSGDMIGLDFFDRNNYVDNEYFRDVLLRVVESVESQYRVNGLTYDNNKPVNEVLGGLSGSSLMRNIMLMGNPGTGKTMLVEAVCAATGIPCVTMRINEYTESDALTESVKVSGQGYETIKSRFFWVAKFGGVFLLDDATNGRTGILFATVGGLMDEPFRLESGEDITLRHPMCFIAATANIGTVSAQEIEQALNNRFSLPLLVRKLPDSSFKATIRAQALQRSGLDLPAVQTDKIVDWVYDVHQSSYAFCRTANAEAAEQLFSLRNAITLCEKIICNLVIAGRTMAIKEAIRAYANPLYLQNDEMTASQIEDAIQSKSVAELEELEAV